MLRAGEIPLFPMSAFYVKVEPGSERFGIDVSGTYPRVSLEAEPSQGRANEELVRRLSEVLGCAVGIVSGHRSRRKKLVADMPEDEVKRILEDYPG